MMSLPHDIEKTIKAYLASVARNLEGVSADERDEVLQNLESHIYEAIHQRCGDRPTLELVQSILLELEPPSSYRNSVPVNKPEPAVVRKSQSKVSRHAIVGLSLISTTFALFPMWFTASSVTTSNQADVASETESVNSVLKLAAMLVFFVLPALSSILGFIAISKIRRSDGEITGLPLAVGVALFFPLALFDMLLFAFIEAQFRISGSGGLLVILLLAAMDVAVVWWTWKAVRGSSSQLSPIS